MFGEYTNRELALIAVAFLIAGVLTAWGTVFVVQKYAIGERNDPLAKPAG
jgi:hypothetical protein